MHCPLLQTKKMSIFRCDHESLFELESQLCSSCLWYRFSFIIEVNRYGKLIWNKNSRINNFHQTSVQQKIRRKIIPEHRPNFHNRSIVMKLIPILSWLFVIFGGYFYETSALPLVPKSDQNIVSIFLIYKLHFHSRMLPVDI